MLFDGQPVAGRLVKAWNKQGKVALQLPYAGPWMVNLVHMIPASDSIEADWDSFWGSLKFEMAA